MEVACFGEWGGLGTRGAVLGLGGAARWRLKAWTWVGVVVVMVGEEGRLRMGGGGSGAAILDAVLSWWRFGYGCESTGEGEWE